MAIKRLSRPGLAVPTNIANPNNNINSGSSTISTTDNVLWLNSKQINKGIKIEYQNNGKVQTTTIQRPPTKKSFASLFHILAYTFTFIVMSLNIYVQYHSNQYNMHISRAKELLQRSKLGMGGTTAMDPTHRSLQAVDSEEVIKALKELTKAEEEEVTFTLPESLAMNVADYIPDVLPDAMELMNDINNYTHSLAADFVASDAEMAANLHEYVKWGKSNVHDLLSSAHDWIDTVKVNGLRGSSADVDTEKEDTASYINEDSGDVKDGAAWMDGLDEDEDNEEDIKLMGTIKRRSLPDVDTTQQQENNSVVSDENGVEDSSSANEAVVVNPIKDTSIKEDTIKSSKEKSSTPSDTKKDEVVDVKEVVKKILPSIATAEAKLDAKSPERSTKKVTVEHKPSKGLAATKTSLIKPRGVVKGEETHLNKQQTHHQDKKEKASTTQKKAVSLAATTTNQAVSSYTFENALQVFDVYDDSVAVVIYDPKEDKFNFLYTDDIKWDASHFKRIRTVMTNSLRRLHPDRFNPKASEFVFVLASNDYPQYKFEQNKCYHNYQGKSCVPNNFPPILQLGSVFKHPVVPSTIAMPLAERNHLPCFHQWLEHGSVCKLLKPKAKGNPQGIEFGNQEWKDLIPQVVWRGADQSFLHRVIHGLRKPHFDTDVEPKLTGKKDKKNTDATKALRAVYDHLLPRWKGVVLTSEAEHAQPKGGALPWANIKFTSAVTHGKDNNNKAFYNKFVKHGIPALGEPMSHEELSKYKYHIDIGGSGGTAIDTIDKLAMPGLLFHHETQTKDYLHSIMKPMVHYVPVRGDLSDLHAKFEWAEKNPDKAQKIAKQASHLVKRLSTDAGFLKLFKELFEEPLSSAVAAYKPLKNGVSWREFINKHKGGNKRTLRPRWKCVGLEQGDCLEVHGNLRLRHDSSKAEAPAKKANLKPHQVVVDLV